MDFVAGTKYLCLQPVERKTAALIGEDITGVLAPFRALALTLTFDNDMVV